MRDSDSYHFERFIDAQQGIYEQALSELKRGLKVSHWMWFIFPQIEGLGVSYTAKRYAIRSLDEAREYLAHPILGRRLVECAEVLLNTEGKSASEIFGSPDDMKLKSSMTLFAKASEPGSVFERVIENYFAGHPDQRTLVLLGA